MQNLILQAAPSGASGQIMSLLPLVAIGFIFYFLLIRPQNQRMKAHKVMLSEVQRGDTVVTNGGLIGKVTKVTDEDLIIDLGEGMKVKVVRSMIADVRGRPAPANDRAAGKVKAKAKAKK